MPREGSPRRRRKYLGPESDFYDELKGQVVQVELDRGVSLTARLAWVDRFTIGLADLKTGKRTMWYKHAIRAIERSEKHGASEHSG